MYYKLSKYNIITRDFNNDIIIANTLNNTFAKYNGENREKVYNIMQCRHIDSEELSLYPSLYENHFVIDASVDELFVADLKYYQLVYSNDTLDITIIPTDACNFNCIYCYQEDRIYEYMDRSIAEKILLYLKKTVDIIKK